MLITSLIVLGATLRVVDASCPESCVCGNNAIVCKCKQDANVTRLGNFHNIEYIGKIYIHTCKRLLIGTDTFKGLAVSDEINIFNVQELIFEPNAFRLMIKYPDQIIIRDSAIPLIRQRAFSGVHHIKHLWFRNTQIGLIETRAFEDVYEMDYLYFRESSVGKINNGAFEDLKNIRNFFMRGQTKIGTIGYDIFGRSIINQIIIEDATIRSMHPYIFGGLRQAKSITLRNITVDAIPLNWRIGSYRQVVSLGSLKIQKCKIAAVVPSTFSNTEAVAIEISEIGQVLGSKHRLTNVSTVRFTLVTIKSILEEAFAKSARISDIVFQKCDIGRVGHAAFKQLELNTFMLINSHVQRFASDTFANSTIRSLIIDNSRIGMIGRDFLMNLRASFLKISESNISTINQAALKRIVVDELVVEKNRFGLIQNNWLNEGQARKVTINENLFQTVRAKLFGGFGTQNLEMRNNLFGCKCDLFFRRLQYFDEKGSTIARTITAQGNRCFEFGGSPNTTFSIQEFSAGCRDVPAIYRKPLVEKSENEVVSCVRMLLGTECFCNRSNQALVIDKNLAQSLFAHQINILLIHSCDSVIVESNAFWSQSIFWLKFYRNRELFIKVDAFSGVRYLEHVTIERCDMNRIPAGSLSFRQSLGSLVIRDLRIVTVESGAIVSSHIETLEIIGCNLSTLQTSAISKVSLRNLTISNNWIANIQSNAINVGPSHDGFIMKGNKIGKLAKEAIYVGLLSETSFSRNGIFCHCAWDFITNLSRFRMPLLEVNDCIAPKAVAGHTLSYALKKASFILQNGILESCPKARSQVRFRQAKGIKKDKKSKSDVPGSSIASKNPISASAIGKYPSNSALASNLPNIYTVCSYLFLYITFYF